MAKWAVDTYVYDNGKIKAEIRKAKEGERAVAEEYDDYNFYTDIFDDHKRAKQWYKDALSA